MLASFLRPIGKQTIHLTAQTHAWMRTRHTAVGCFVSDSRTMTPHCHSTCGVLTAPPDNQTDRQRTRITGQPLQQCRQYCTHLARSQMNAWSSCNAHNRNRKTTHEVNKQQVSCTSPRRCTAPRATTTERNGRNRHEIVAIGKLLKALPRSGVAAAAVF